MLHCVGIKYLLKNALHKLKHLGPIIILDNSFSSREVIRNKLDDIQHLVSEFLSHPMLPLHIFRQGKTITSPTLTSIVIKSYSRPASPAPAPTPFYKCYSLTGQSS